MIRSVCFQAAYWFLTVFFALTALPLLVLPGRRALSGWIRLYGRAMRHAMQVSAGVRVEVREIENFPIVLRIIAATHQSWADGFIIIDEIPDLAVVVGDHLARFPMVGGFQRKLSAIVVDNRGGAYARVKLVDDKLKRAVPEDRRVLIFPECRLSPADERHRYKRRVFHMYAAYNRPFAPVAANLVLFWPQQNWRLSPGSAIVEFLAAIAPVFRKDALMRMREGTIETRSHALPGSYSPYGAAIARPPLPDPVS